MYKMEWGAGASERRESALLARDALYHPKYRPDIDGLRGLAVLSVVWFHAFPASMSGGFIGVDIFFVISGYLITTIILESLDRHQFSFAAFYGRRIRRIFPALLLVLVATYALGWVFFLPDDFAQLGKHIAAGSGFVSNLVLWSEAGYFDKSAEAKPLLHLWSLGVEEQFYIAWPILLWGVWKRNVSVLAVTAIVFCASFALNKYGISHDRVATFYSPLTRFWELLAGSLLAWASLHKSSVLAVIRVDRLRALARVTRREGSVHTGRLLYGVMSVIGWSLLVFGFWRINKNLKFPGDWALVPVAGTVLIIAAGQAALINRVVLSNRILVWIGLISFPLYLWHWPLLVFARIFEDGAPSVGSRVAAVLAAMVLAWLTYALVERPVRADGRRMLKSAALVSLMVLVGAAGYITYQKGGLEFRIPQSARDLLRYDFDYKKYYRAGSCFLQGEQDHRVFSKCNDNYFAGRKTILIWGDSHAAHLYPGFERMFGGSVNIVQRSNGLCPSLVGFEIEISPHCRVVNDYVFEQLKDMKPDIVVMSSAWSVYGVQNYAETIKKIKSIGIENIMIVGPVPQWEQRPAQLLYNAYLKSIPRAVPNRLRHGLIREVFEIEGALKESAKQNGVVYVPAKDILCNADGCLTRVGETADTLVAWDKWGHLTAKGSEFLVSKFPRFF